MQKNNKVVLTYYYTGEVDFWHQESSKPKVPDPLDFFVLKKSVDDFPDWDFHTLANEFEPDWAYTKIQKPKELTFFVHKFIAMKEWIESHPEYEWFWIVDTSDTQMLSNKPMNKNTLYLGFDAWYKRRRDYQKVREMCLGGFRKFTHSEYIHSSLRRHYSKNNFNCGVIGGHRDILLPFLIELEELMLKYPADLEMVTFNYLIFEKYIDKINICTTRLNCRELQTPGRFCYWRHK